MTHCYLLSEGFVTKCPYNELCRCIECRYKEGCLFSGKDIISLSSAVLTQRVVKFKMPLPFKTGILKVKIVTFCVLFVFRFLLSQPRTYLSDSDSNLKRSSSEEGVKKSSSEDGEDSDSIQEGKLLACSYMIDSKMVW